jgi:hypothetical protein
LGIYFLIFKKESINQTPVAHTCNPSYSGGRDQEDGGSKLTRANKLTKLYLKNGLTQKGLIE